MAEKPVAPSGEFKLKTVVYAKDGIRTPMSDNEILKGRNNTGEVETPLGSVPMASKENWFFCYLNEHIVYLTKMVEYLDSKAK